MKGRSAIKQLATKKGQRVKDLLVLSEFNDPFYVGSKTQYANAEWARELYLLLRPKRTVHIRRLHYFALTQPQHRKPNGRIYTNTEANWKFLTCACKFARYLNLLPYDAFIDRRNLFQPPQKWPIIKCDHPGQWRHIMIETIERLCRLHIRFMLSRLLPVHIEIWVEKSTAADLLESIAKKYNINIVTSMGDISLTAVWQFTKRIANCNKPVRMFYISDFDPAGENMPISVARKIEFLLRQHKLSRKVDVKLKPLMLTRRQCKKFNLPGIPLPVNVKGNYSFTRYHGRIVTELHTLEVARPGYICKLVNNQLKRYLDVSKITRAAKIADNAITQLSDQFAGVIDRSANLAVVFRIMENLLAQSNLTQDCDAHGPWLLDSHRDYLTQLATYQLHRLR